MSPVLDNKLQRLRSYSAHVSRLLARKQTTQEIYEILLSSRSALSGRGVDYDRPCTGSETQCCHMLDDLDFWNEFLWLCHMEIKEVAPGELGTETLQAITPDVASVALCHHAHILLHWLLKQHHCIRALKVKSVVVLRNPKLFFDALRINNGLRRLELSDCDLEAECKTIIKDGSQHLVAAIGTLTVLEELVLHNVYMSKKALSLLGTAFENMPCLRSFSARLDYMTIQETDILIQSLKRSRTIKALHCNDWFLRHGQTTTFAEYLAEHDVLEELFLEMETGSRCRGRNFEPVFDALARNCVLRKFHLVGYIFEPSHGWLLSKVMSANNTLQVFRISGNRCTFEGDSLAEMIRTNTGLLELDMGNVAVAGTEQLVDAICTNTTLKKLSLCWSELSLEDTTKVCKALAENCSVEMVTGEDVDEHLIPEMYRVLRETRTDKRVQFNSVIKTHSVLQRTLDCCHELTKVTYRPAPQSLAATWRKRFASYSDIDYGLDSEDISYFSGRHQNSDGTFAPELSAFSCFTSCSQLVTLQITLDDKMNRTCAEQLARFLSSTKKLRHADLNFPTTLSATQVLLDAVSQNKSVSTLIVSHWQFSKDHAEDFAKILQRNETLNYLELYHVKADIVLKKISTRLASNKFLVSIKVDDDCYVDDEVWMFVIMNVLRRNSSLLQRAAQFVIGKYDKRCGEAFEEVSMSLALSEKVQQLAGGSGSDAEERIRASRGHLDTNFLAVAGVVNERLVCENRGEVRTQFDEIGLDNWLRVRSFLKLTDIKNSPANDRCSLSQQTKPF